MSSASQRAARVCSATFARAFLPDHDRPQHWRRHSQDSEARCSHTLVHRYPRPFFEDAGVPNFIPGQNIDCPQNSQSRAYWSWKQVFCKFLAAHDPRSKRETEPEDKPHQQHPAPNTRHLQRDVLIFSVSSMPLVLNSGTSLHARLILSLTCATWVAGASATPLSGTNSGGSSLGSALSHCAPFHGLVLVVVCRGSSAANCVAPCNSRRTFSCNRLRSYAARNALFSSLS